MKVIHISQQRYGFIRSLGYKLSVAEHADAILASRRHGVFDYHVLADETALCNICDCTCASVDANSPAELEIYKLHHPNYETFLTAVREHRQELLVWLRDFPNNQLK